MKRKLDWVGIPIESDFPEFEMALLSSHQELYTGASPFPRGKLCLLELAAFSRKLEASDRKKSMHEGQDFDTSRLEAQFEALQQEIYALARGYQGNSRALLTLLRSLEALHRQIREELLNEALPNNRRELERLLRDIEEMGGWPYIERPRLQAFLSKFWQNCPEKEEM